MGTRSLTYVYDNNEPVVCMYRQMDGYPSGHGKELAEFLKSLRLVNGIPLDTTVQLANGMDCLAAQMVAHFKKGVGGFYLISVKASDHGQDYEYHVCDDRVVIKEQCSKGTSTVFSGTWAEFLTYCEGMA